MTLKEKEDSLSLLISDTLQTKDAISHWLTKLDLVRYLQSTCV